MQVPTVSQEGPAATTWGWGGMGPVRSKGYKITMAYLLSNHQLVDAARALHNAQEDATHGEQGGNGVPAYLYVLLSVTDDTRAKLVQDPNWLMEDHSGDGQWEEAQEAFADWENDDDTGDWVEEHMAAYGDRWVDWVQPVRELIAVKRRIAH